MNIEYKIFQPKKVFKRYHGFLGYDSYKSIHKGKEININRYNEMYVGKLEFKEEETIEKILEELFRKFNIDHPTDFHGHSLSVGDIVYIDRKLYYCDSFGWKELEVFDIKPATCSLEEYCIFEHGRFFSELLESMNYNDLVEDFKQFCWEQEFIAEQIEEG